MSPAAAAAGILFGRERYGLQNEEVALANRIITFPVNPGFASLNLAQAVLPDRLRVVQAVDRRRAAVRDAANGPSRPRSTRCRPSSTIWSGNSTEVEFLRPAEKRETMLVNLRNIFTRMDPTKQDMHTLHGVVMAIAEGRKGPAKGGVLDGEQATRLARAAGRARARRPPPSEQRHRARDWPGLLRRNPTDAERILWQALTTRPPLRRAVQTPDPGRPPHPGFRLLRAPDRDRAGQPRPSLKPSSPTVPRRQAWLEARDYRVIEMRVAAMSSGICQGAGAAGEFNGETAQRLMACSLLRVGIQSAQETRDETRRPHRKAALISSAKGWSWKHICERIGGYSEVLIVGAILGQMKLTKPQAANAGELFGLSKSRPRC